MEGLQDQDEKEEAFRKSVVALMRWKRFIIRLRIKERLGIYDEVPEDNRVEHPMPKGKEPEHVGGELVAANDNGDDDGGGGFLIGGDEDGGFIVGDDGSTKAQESDRDSDMLSEDPDDRDNEDLDWM
jgi:xeroderma pigmentosum group C-complementing protein